MPSGLSVNITGLSIFNSRKKSLLKAVDAYNE